MCSLLVRTDFSDDIMWREVIAAALAPTPEGFTACLDICEDPAFTGLAAAELIRHLPNGHTHRFLFVVDAVTIQTAEHPLLAVDLVEELGRELRAVPSYAQVIGDNLNLANMWFQDFVIGADRDGIARPYTAPPNRS